jgi:hypothetical protein
VHAIDGRPLAVAPGPLTAEAARRVRERIERELAAPVA